MTAVAHCSSCGVEVSANSKFCKECGAPLKSSKRAKPGFYNGRHYTTYVDEVQQLIKENKLDEAEKLLLELLDANESEARKNNWPVAPWYYERLAIVYRKKKDTDSEIKLLERFERQRGGGPRTHKLLQRLDKLRAKQMRK